MTNKMIYHELISKLQYLCEGKIPALNEYEFLNSEYAELAEVINTIICNFSKGELNLPSKNNFIINPNFILKIFDEISDLIIISNVSDKTILFANKNASVYFSLDANFAPHESKKDSLAVVQSYIHYQINEGIQFNDEQSGKWFYLRNNFVEWKNSEYVCIQILCDVSFFKNRELELEAAAKTDAMTGALNRRSAEEHLNHMINNIDEYGCISVIYFDVDNLKIINDCYGHTNGDKALCAISNIVKSVIRTDDFFFRLGGDEFLVIIPKYDKNATYNVVERIQEYISNYNKEDNLQFNISISCGIAETNSQSHIQASEILSVADKEMYKEKAKKRKERKIHKKVF